MTGMKGINMSHRDMPASKSGNTSDAMWDFLKIRYRKDKTESDDKGKDDDFEKNELCLLGQLPNEQIQLAMPPDDNTVENSLSKELMKLSINDRTAIEEEVHGVSSTPEETPDFLAERLHEFDKELMNAKNCPERRRKLQRNRGISNDDEGTLGNADKNDVLRNVISMSTRDIQRLGELSSTSTMDTEESTYVRALTPPKIPSSQTSIGSDPKKSCYVNDPNIRLRFIRAEGYDAKMAVNRFISFLVFAQELYGDFVADRPIQISDLKSPKEKRTLANISFQFLPYRDRSGRRVFVSVGSCGYDVEPVLRIKILWYMFWIASEDVESQRKGVVIIGWPNNNKLEDDAIKNFESDSDESKSSSRNMWDELRPSLLNREGIFQIKAMVGLPMRVASVHFCHEIHPMFSLLNTLFHFALSPSLRSKYKVHVGNPIEIRYKLQGYGIPVDLLPLTHTLALKRQNHSQWIAFRRMVEQGKSSSIDPEDMVDCPRSYDVIIGKAKYTNNPGNVFYRSLIEDTHDDHMSLSKRDKVELTWKVVRQMEERNGRFLEFKKSVKVFVCIRDRNIMRQKVAQSFKEYKRTMSVVRSKRQLKQEDTNIPMPCTPAKQIQIPKRQKVELPLMFEKECNDALNSFLNRFNCEDDDDFHVSTSIFAAM